MAACTAATGRHAFATIAPVDSLYDSHHPRLLFTPGELEELRSLLVDGGEDDVAYDYIRSLVESSYPYWSAGSLLSEGYGIGTIPNLGLAAWVAGPFDSAAAALGRTLTLHVADNYAVDYDEGNSGLRLRTLVLGYDMFFRGAPYEERARVFDEIIEYVEFIVDNPAYEVFTYQPYLGNHSAMFAGALGLAAICLHGEADAGLLASALELTDRVCDRLLLYQFDPDGTYKEGAFYGLWTMRNLVYYFHARKRHDGYSYGDHPRVRAMENALAYELLPEGGAASNNLNDSNYTTYPFARSTTYFDWAIHEWDSGLSTWIWDRVAGAYGVNMLYYADKAATALWHRRVPMVAPGTVLPGHFLWRDRGLYYYRTGWQSERKSDDVVFSFYSGKFQGGHAQEDQNQFTLYAYGDKYAIDHGSGNVAKQSESHNIVFIDGAGQHNAGSSIGTDGDVAEYLLSGFADYLLGDATAAYTTHSEFNDPDRPFPGTDWSWGYKGANPVLYAHRRVLAVHGQGPPYFVLLDDIDKDGQMHAYQWRLHTRLPNSVDATANPIVVTGDSSAMDIHVLDPPFASLGATTETYNNQTSEPDSKLLRLTTSAVDPHFALLLFPHDAQTTVPQVSRSAYPWGYAVTLDWGGGVVDHILRNDGGAAASHAGVDTDSRLLVVRRSGTAVSGYLAVGTSTLSVDGALYAECTGGRMGCALWGSALDVDRYDAPYRFLDTGLSTIHYRSQELGFTVDGGYAVPDGVSRAGDSPRPAPAIDVVAFPNPFNPQTSVRVRAPAGSRVDVAVYDVAGRRVRRLWSGVVGEPERLVAWDGRGDDGDRVASGAYLVRATAGGRSGAVKVILLK
jgi:hypothetical protein